MNGDLSLQDINTMKISEVLQKLLDSLAKKKLWIKRIPSMLQLYYLDMFSVIEQCYAALEEEGFCSIVVGNSSMGELYSPTRFLIFSRICSKIGFKVDKIEVDRYIITSSQQYDSTKEYGKYLREGVWYVLKINNQIIVENLPENIEFGGTYIIAQSNPNTYTHSFFKYPCRFYTRKFPGGLLKNIYLELKMELFLTRFQVVAPHCWKVLLTFDAYGTRN